MATATNRQGETLPSLAGVLIDTVLDDAVSGADSFDYNTSSLE